MNTKSKITGADDEGLAAHDKWIQDTFYVNGEFDWDKMWSMVGPQVSREEMLRDLFESARRRKAKSKKVD